MAKSKKKSNSSASFDLLSGIAQELDAPLQSMVKSSQKLIDDFKARDFEYVAYKDFKAIIGTIEQINRQLKRCAQTTKRLKSLDQSHLTSSHCQINEVVKEVVELFEQQLKSAKIKILLRLSPDVPAVKLSKIEGHQIIHNILINAIQAMPAGGKIRIQTTADLVRNIAQINISDEGVGITPEHLSKIFEPFFTTKERGVEKSAGLGLSIVYSIVHAAGGDINIQSSLRKGTLVHIDLPVSPSKS